jgi:succinate dehydrogenase / fumarate reductase flavoprotein subunit
MAAPRIIVIGGGLAGLAAVIKIAEAGGTVDLFSIVPVKRSHSVCAQGGINAAKEPQGRGRHHRQALRRHHLRRRLPGQPDARQGHVRSGARHHRSARPHGRALQSHPEGLLDFRRFGGTLYHRTAFAGATTGQQLLYALDEQVRRHESAGKVNKYEGWEFLSAVSTPKA